MKIKKVNKKAIANEYIIWILLGVAFLAVLMIFAYLLRDQLFALGDKIVNLFRFR